MRLSDGTTEGMARTAHVTPTKEKAMATGTPLTDEQRSLIVSLSSCPNWIIQRRTGFSTQTIARVLKQSMQTELLVRIWEGGQITFHTDGKPLPCKVTVHDYAFDPLEVDDPDYVKTDIDGDDYAHGTFEKGEVMP